MNAFISNTVFPSLRGQLLDRLLAPVLSISPDLALLALVLLTVCLVLLIRRLTIHPPSLQATIRDLGTLKKLLRATDQRDRSTRLRFRTTRARVARRRLRSELPAALLSLLLLIPLVSWGWRRLEYHAPRTNEPLALSVILPASHVNQTVHILPGSVEFTDGPVRVVRLITRNGRPVGRADWLITARLPGLHQLTLRAGSTTLQTEVLIGGPFYSPTTQRHGADVTTEVVLQPYEPFGIVPALPWLRVPGWLVAYFLLVMSAVQIARRVVGWG